MARKALVTGARGTVGSALCAHLTARGHQVVAWPRDRIAPWDVAAMAPYLRGAAPDLAFHLAIASRSTGTDHEGWRVNVEWAGALAGMCGELDIPFIFTSTAMVFSDQARGPFTRQASPDAREGYGYEKRMAEALVRDKNPAARIVRLGWQIGTAPGSNNMIDYLAARMTEHGEVRASTAWLPATSFLDDTAAVLADVVERPPGLYMIDSNRGWSFYDIACALNQQHGEPWTITATDDFVYDQRLLDDDLDVPSLATRLPQLPALA